MYREATTSEDPRLVDTPVDLSWNPSLPDLRGYTRKTVSCTKKSPRYILLRWNFEEGHTEFEISVSTIPLSPVNPTISNHRRNLCGGTQLLLRPQGFTPTVGESVYNFRRCLALFSVCSPGTLEKTRGQSNEADDWREKVLVKEKQPRLRTSLEGCRVKGSDIRLRLVPRDTSLQ